MKIIGYDNDETKNKINNKIILFTHLMYLLLDTIL
jgi:hypothetical protein